MAERKRRYARKNNVSARSFSEEVIRYAVKNVRKHYEAENARLKAENAELHRQLESAQIDDLKSRLKKLQAQNANTCVCCNEIIPEGRQVCTNCEIKRACSGVMTRFEKIKTMTIDEMTEILKDMTVRVYGLCSDCHVVIVEQDYACTIKEWLEKEC